MDHSNHADPTTRPRSDDCPRKNGNGELNASFFTRSQDWSNPFPRVDNERPHKRGKRGRTP
jgi:hypothetical protein